MTISIRLGFRNKVIQTKAPDVRYIHLLQGVDQILAPFRQSEGADEELSPLHLYAVTSSGRCEISKESDWTDFLCQPRSESFVFVQIVSPTPSLIANNTFSERQLTRDIDADSLHFHSDTEEEEEDEFPRMEHGQRRMLSAFLERATSLQLSQMIVDLAKRHPSLPALDPALCRASSILVKRSEEIKRTFYGIVWAKMWLIRVKRKRALRSRMRSLKACFYASVVGMMWVSRMRRKRSEWVLLQEAVFQIHCDSRVAQELYEQETLDRGIALSLGRRNHEQILGDYRLTQQIWDDE